MDTVESWRAGTDSRRDTTADLAPAGMSTDSGTSLWADSWSPCWRTTISLSADSW